MKKIYTTMLIALLINATADKCLAQWTPVYQDNYAQFYDAAFPTDLSGYVAASDTGGVVVLRTNDGGMTWNKKYIAGWSFVDKIIMADSITGYLIRGGVPGQILKTNDGFTTYTLQNTDTSFIVQAISLLNDSTGFYLNNAARLRKFENNGSSVSHIIDTLIDGQNLQFVNSHTGYLDTGNGLLMTSDTGVTWNFVNDDLGFFCAAFNFTDSVNGYFSDFTKIYTTNDGGITFPLQYDFPNVYSFAANGNFCMAANDTGNVTYTTNGGLTWQTEITGINFVVAEPYNAVITPGGSCFLFSEFCGEIRKRLPIVAGITYSSVDYHISVYPNPFTSETTIAFAEPQQNTIIQVTDVSGKEISRTRFTGTQLILERGEWDSGIYFITITDETNSVILTRKIVIQ